MKRSPKPLAVFEVKETTSLRLSPAERRMAEELRVYLGMRSIGEVLRVALADYHYKTMPEL